MHFGLELGHVVGLDPADVVTALVGAGGLDQRGTFDRLGRRGDELEPGGAERSYLLLRIFARRAGDVGVWEPRGRIIPTSTSISLQSGGEVSQFAGVASQIR
ncbi:hypothetical protein CQ047_07285 [Microbacterium sp. MYb72]|nr:hypothetical protein CQ047_07285 [Microbacterium sp. MYb72]